MEITELNYSPRAYDKVSMITADLTGVRIKAGICRRRFIAEPE